MRKGVRSTLIALFLIVIMPAGFYYYFYKDGLPKPIRLPKYIALTDEEGKVITEEKRSRGRSYLDTVYHTIPDFSFISNKNEVITQDVMEDKITVVDYFFSTCPGICIPMSNHMKAVQYQFIRHDDLLLLSHTVDPEYDTPEILDEYAERHDARYEKWKFLTGGKPELYHQARKGYFISASEGDGGVEDFIHSNKFVLVDKKKVIRGYYDGTDSTEVARLAEDIYILKLEYEKRDSIDYEVMPDKTYGSEKS